MRIGGIVLCGGHSTRMGTSKAWLPVGSERMLQRVVRLVAGVTDPIVVVAAADQELPPLPNDVFVSRDRRPDCGPLGGIESGLAALQRDADAAYVTSCDVPLLVPGFIRRMVDSIENYQIAVPVQGEFQHPLAAVYRVDLLPVVQQLLDSGRRRPAELFDSVRTVRVDASSLHDVDPQLKSLMNMNRPADYMQALDELGFTAPGDFHDQATCNGDG